MRCEDIQAYTPIQNPTQSMAPKYGTKTSPYGGKQSPVSSSPAPVSHMCLDYVVKTVQDGNFLAVQDGSTMIFNLDN